MKQLRPMQEHAIAQLRQSLARGCKRVMLKAPTGAGKTVIASHIVDMARQKGKRVIFCVNAISLVDQTAQKFFEEGITEIGVIQGQHELTDYSKPVQIASVQTLQRRKHIPDADLVIIDEAHNWFKFYSKWMAEWDAIPFIGLSATPYTKGLGKYYDDLIIAADTQELIDQGWLSSFKVYAPSHPDLEGVRTVAGDYHEGDLNAAMDKAPLVADIVQTWKKLGDDMPTLCYGVTRAHAQHIQQEFLGAGIPCGYMDSYTEIEERREIAKQFKSGELKVICNVGVLTTGIDWDVRCIILARPTKSDILFQQIIGRGLRTADGKEFCKILDHSDTHLRLGFVTDIDSKHERLCDGKPKQKEAQKQEPALPKECPSCHVLKPVRVHVCPHCGFAPQQMSNVVHIDGELSELTASQRKANKEHTEEQKMQFLGELVQYSIEKGYKTTWAKYKFKEKFGQWPDQAVSPQPVTSMTRGYIQHMNIKAALGRRKGLERLDELKKVFA